MSNLSTIGPVPGSQTRKVRVARGRGTGIGGTSGRGMNGQNSRTGKGKRYPTFEGGQTRLFMRTPKKRGFTAFNPEQFVVVNLGRGKLSAKGEVTADTASASAKAAIEKAGGTLTVSE